jgi:flavin-dependent dehydrogenase
MASPAMTTNWDAHSNSALPLDSGSRVAVIGGGPAGSFFGYLILEYAHRVGVDLAVTVFEPRDFSGVGPASCNMCGGIISESLVQVLASAGINLPSDVVQRGIDSYVLHMDVGSVRIETPLHEMRIGAVHRASGPRDLKAGRWVSFDGFLQKLAVEHGSTLVREKVTELHIGGDRPQLVAGGQPPQAFDLVAVATGVNASTLKVSNGTAHFEAPKTTKTLIREYFLGEDTIGRVLGNSMHVFLLPIPGLEFAAIIPKGDYASVCLLGNELDKATYDLFVNSPEVRSCMPAGWDPLKNSCQCAPRINILGTPRPFADRVVFIGDSGSTRLYKDGIGAAYRTANAAARTAVFHGVGQNDFQKHYQPACGRIEKDNAIGRFMFGMTRCIHKSARVRRALLTMTAGEQKRPGGRRRMSAALWDLFTGSSSYRQILVRTFHPAFIGRLGYHLARSAVNGRPLIHRGAERTAP